MKVAICITNYNNAPYLIEALESAIFQTIPPNEIVLVDDASSDESVAIFQQYQLKFPQLIKTAFHEQNQGVSRTRNHALSLVNSDYVTFLDSDDSFMPDKLERELDQLSKDGGANFVFSNYRVIDMDGNTKYDWLSAETEIVLSNLLYHLMVRDLPRWSLFRSELVHFPFWKTVGFFDENMTIWEDDEMRIRLAAQGKATFCNHTLSTYRTTMTGLSSKPLSLHADALQYLYQKNKALISSLNPIQQEKADFEMRKYVAHHCRKASREALAKKLHRQSWQYLWTAIRYNPIRNDIWTTLYHLKALLRESMG